MDPELVRAIITIILTAIAGALGYFFREYRNRVSPFISIMEISGEHNEPGSEVEVPDKVIETMQPSLLLTKLRVIDNLDYVLKGWDQANLTIHTTKEYIALTNKIIAAAKSNNLSVFQTSLGQIIAFHDFIIINLIANGKVNIGGSSQEVENEISIYPHPEGGVLISFPGLSPVRFGREEFQQPLVQAKCKPFLDALQNMDLQILSAFFANTKDIIETELSIAKEVEPILRDIVYKKSLWIIRIYIANLGRNPFLIKNTGTLHVNDEGNGAKYDEECQLVQVGIDKDGRPTERISIAPLVVSGEQDVIFAFITVKSQGEMKLGHAFRDSFLRGQAHCWLEFDVEKAGFFRNKSLKTPKSPFLPTTWRKADPSKPASSSN